MSREERSAEVEARSEQLLRGPLQHVRAAALAAVLVPLASVAAAPAMAQTCASGGATVGDFVWHDANGNGVQDAGEPGISSAVVSAVSADGTHVTYTGETGYYLFYGLCPGEYRIEVQIPPGMQPSPVSQGGDPALDSNGVPDGAGHSVARVQAEAWAYDDSIDFGFVESAPPGGEVGTGTPGYWMNHPEAWPVEEITVGGKTYSKSEALAWLWKKGADRTLTMFSSLVPAMLNVRAGTDASCVQATIDAANAWMSAPPVGYGPVGSRVHPASYAWKVGEPLHRTLDNYNNGMLCAPSRDALE